MALSNQIDIMHKELVPYFGGATSRPTYQSPHKPNPHLPSPSSQSSKHSGCNQKQFQRTASKPKPDPKITSSTLPQPGNSSLEQSESSIFKMNFSLEDSQETIPRSTHTYTQPKPYQNSKKTPAIVVVEERKKQSVGKTSDIYEYWKAKAN